MGRQGGDAAEGRVMAVDRPEVASGIVRYWMGRNFEFRGKLPVRTRAGFRHKGGRVGGSASDGWSLVYPTGDWLEFAHPRSQLFPSAPGATDYRHRAVVDALAQCPPVAADGAVAWAATVEKWRSKISEYPIRRRWLREDAGRILDHPVRHRRVIWYREGEPCAAMTVGELCRARLEGLGVAPAAPAETRPPTRDERIVEAMRSYTGRRTLCRRWPWLRPLRRHAGIRDITAAERKRLWPRVRR